MRWQVEQRLRQLEGKLLASDSAKPYAGKGDIPKYNAQRQGDAGAALIAPAKVYNPDADVTADAGNEQKKKKKKVIPAVMLQVAHLRGRCHQICSHGGELR